MKTCLSDGHSSLYTVHTHREENHVWLSNLLASCCPSAQPSPQRRASGQLLHPQQQLSPPARSGLCGPRRHRPRQGQAARLHAQPGQQRDLWHHPQRQLASVRHHLCSAPAPEKPGWALTLRHQYNIDCQRIDMDELMILSDLNLTSLLALGKWYLFIK